MKVGLRMPGSKVREDADLGIASLRRERGLV